MPTLVAQTQLYNRGEYGRVAPGQQFQCSEDTARVLERAGHARRVYETKVIVPEVRPVVGDPFRDGFVPYAGPPAVAAESDTVLPVADLPEPRVANRGQRPGRKTSGPRG